LTVIMCCFSQPVKKVSSTNIFAREGEDGRQFSAYSMFLNVGSEVAMILPLPVRTPTGEKDVQFIDLKGYPNFFSDLESGFPRPLPDPTASAGGGGLSIPSSRPKLAVLEVGDFEASFVPTVSDFSRLDERFRLPPDAWNDVPVYKDYGFAVFKLKPGAMTIHPMAFSFPRRHIRSLFFPTVHIHDGKVHPNAYFDHSLFCQPRAERALMLQGQWQESYTHPTGFMQVEKTKGIIQPDQHCYKRELRGTQPNRDTFLVIHA